MLCDAVCHGVDDLRRAVIVDAKCDVCRFTLCPTETVEEVEKK